VPLPTVSVAGPPGSRLTVTSSSESGTQSGDQFCAVVEALLVALARPLVAVGLGGERIRQARDDGQRGQNRKPGDCATVMERPALPSHCIRHEASWSRLDRELDPWTPRCSGSGHESIEVEVRWARGRGPCTAPCS
jgi:hypothetical protein